MANGEAANICLEKDTLFYKRAKVKAWKSYMAKVHGTSILFRFSQFIYHHVKGTV